MTISVLNDIRIPFIPVLTSRDSVKINYHLQAVIPCPLNSLKEIFMLPLDIRLVGCDFVGPIPYWDAHVIESETRIQTWLTDFCSEASHAAYLPSSSNRLKVSLSDPCIPMVHQRCFGGTTLLKLRKCPFVYDGGIARVVKQARCYPRLCGGGPE